MPARWTAGNPFGEVILVLQEFCSHGSRISGAGGQLFLGIAHDKVEGGSHGLHMGPLVAMGGKHPRTD